MSAAATVGSMTIFCSAYRCYVLPSAMKTEAICPAYRRGDLRNAPQNNPVRLPL